MLWAAGTIQKIIACIFLVAGFAIMLICAKKYFADLSGIDVFVKNKPPNTLQVSGLNKYVRHPLYAGTLLFVWALFFINPLLSYLISAILITIYTRIGIYFEEKKLLIEFGDAYKKFSVSTPMLIPHLF